MKGPQPLHMKSAAATCAARGAAASRFLDYFLAVREAHKKMMFDSLQGCLGRLAAADRQYFLRSSIQLSQYSTMRMQTLMPAITESASFPAILNTTVAAAPRSTYR